MQTISVSANDAVSVHLENRELVASRFSSVVFGQSEIRRQILCESKVLRETGIYDSARVA